MKFPTAEFDIKIIGPDGTAVDGIKVSAISFENVPIFMKETVEHTEENGRTKKSVPPGRYKVGVNLFYPPSPEYPFEPTCVPGTQDESRATLFEMMNGDRKCIRLRMERSLTPRKIPVQVVWMEGRPISNANIWLVEATDPETVVGYTVSHTDADGRYDLIGLAGRDYLIRAGIHVRPSYQHHCAEPIAVPASGLRVDRIVLELIIVGDDCRSL